MELQGKTAVITGATGGIGREIARLLAQRSARVVLACRSREKAEALKNELLREFPQVRVDFLPAELSDPRSVKVFTEALCASPPDLLICNAGVYDSPHAFRVNCLAPRYILDRLLPVMAEMPRETCCITTVSLARLVSSGRPEKTLARGKRLGVYALSKRCLAEYTRRMGEKYEHTSLSVHMMHPGIVITPLVTDSFPGWVGNAAFRLRRLFESPRAAAQMAAFIAEKAPGPDTVTGPAFLGIRGKPKARRLRKDPLRERLDAFCARQLPEWMETENNRAVRD